MYLGYNTNGLAHHDLFDAVELLAEIGYRGVAITIDHNALPPGDLARVSSSGATAGLSGSAPPASGRDIERLRRLLEKLHFRSAIETGARFLLDRKAKHEPTLLSESRRRRIDFYKYAIDCAAELGSDCVSLWSGTLHEPTGATAGLSSSDFPRWSTLPDKPAMAPTPNRLSRQQAMARLIEGLREVLDYAATKNVPVGCEPEPGMFIDSMRAFDDFLTRLESGGADIPVRPSSSTASGRQECLPHRRGEDRSARLGPSDLRLTLDIGHLQCQQEMPIVEVIRRWSPRLIDVHLDDMRAGRHEHLMFGEGEIDFSPVLQALAQSGYTGGVFVELSRHSHEGPQAAKKAFEFLQRFSLFH